LGKYVADHEYDLNIERRPEDDDDETLSIPEDIHAPAKRRSEEEFTDFPAPATDDPIAAGTMNSSI